MLTKIGDLIHKDYHLKYTLSKNNSNQKSFIFKENDPSTKLSKLTITNCDFDSIALGIDGIAPFCSYFDPEHKIINKRCDIILINKFQIILIDAKSNNIKKAKVQEQLTNTKFFVEYLISLIIHFYPEIPQDKINIYMCVINTIPFSSKGPINQKTNIQEKITNKLLPYKIIPAHPIKGSISIPYEEIMKKFIPL